MQLRKSKCTCSIFHFLNLFLSRKSKKKGKIPSVSYLDGNFWNSNKIYLFISHSEKWKKIGQKWKKIILNNLDKKLILLVEKLSKFWKKNLAGYCPDSTYPPFTCSATSPCPYGMNCDVNGVLGICCPPRKSKKKTKRFSWLKNWTNFQSIFNQFQSIFNFQSISALVLCPGHVNPLEIPPLCNQVIPCPPGFTCSIQSRCCKCKIFVKKFSFFYFFKNSFDAFLWKKKQKTLTSVTNFDFLS